MIYRSVIGIDPGKVTGLAYFHDGVLMQAESFKQDDPTWEIPQHIAPAILIVEVPRVYHRGGKGDPNDLIDLALWAGELIGKFRERCFHLRVRLVTPRAWKGTVPKSIHNARVLDALSAEERAKLPKRPRARTYDHNMVDAVGLALFQLQREQQR